MKRHLLATVAALSAVVAAAPASAATIVYTIAGTGSGTLAGSAFTDAAFTFTLIGDTDNYTENGSVRKIDPLDSADFDISGMGTGTFLIGTDMGQNNTIVFFSGTSSSGFFDLFDFSIANQVDLLSSFGPFPNTGPVTALTQFYNVPTTAGVLDFDAASDVQFSARLAGAVPEPSTWAMVILGFGLLGGAMRRRGAKVGTQVAQA